MTAGKAIELPLLSSLLPKALPAASARIGERHHHGVWRRGDEWARAESGKAGERPGAAGAGRRLPPSTFSRALLYLGAALLKITYVTRAAPPHRDGQARGSPGAPVQPSDTPSPRDQMLWESPVAD